MAKTWPKVILDPVHNLIPFDDNRCDAILWRLIDTREFQRLRRIKQLGLSELVFPGSNHSRFAHSIGVMHVARLIIDRIAEFLGETIAPEVRLATCAAALLHDIGHGPFSHAFEKVTGDKHEARSLEIISSESTEVNRVLKEADPKLPSTVALFIEPTSREVWERAGVPAFLRHVVSGQLDADRLDYLLRDSLATGTVYGRFDLNWLLLHLKVDKGKNLLYLGRKARSAVETYVFARHHMYKSVYYHKTTRAAEVMLRLALKRYRDLLKACSDDTQRQAIVPDSPRIVLDAFGGSLTLSRYLEFDDFVVTEFLKCCERSNDTLLARLGGGIAHRKLYKARDISGLKGDKVVTFASRARALAEGRGYEPEYAVIADSAADVAYKVYNPAKESEVTQIFIEDDRGDVTELSNESAPVQQLAREVSWLRYYVPGELREEVEKIYAETLKEA